MSVKICYDIIMSVKKYVPRYVFVFNFSYMRSEMNPSYEPND